MCGAWGTSVQDADGGSAVSRGGLLGTDAADTEWAHPRSLLVSKECQKLFKDINDPQPQQKKNPGIYNEGPWLSLGEEELWHYSEPPWGDMDPQVTKIMKNLGLEWDEVQESATESTIK